MNHNFHVDFLKLSLGIRMLGVEGFVIEDNFSNIPRPIFKIIYMKSEPNSTIIKGFDNSFFIFRLSNEMPTDSSCLIGIITSPSSPVGLQSI